MGTYSGKDEVESGAVSVCTRMQATSLGLALGPAIREKVNPGGGAKPFRNFLAS
jgi:hypothetical protein